MNKQVTNLAGRASRRSFLTAIGAGAACAGVTLLAGCNDDVVGAEAVPTPTPTATPTPPVAYEATDSDRSNFTLQLHYLLAAFLQTALTGRGLPTNLTSGTGTPGQVSGGRAVPFTTPALVASVREISTATTARIALLRRTLGSAATAQPRRSDLFGTPFTGPLRRADGRNTTPKTSTTDTTLCLVVSRHVGGSGGRKFGSSGWAELKLRATLGCEPRAAGRRHTPPGVVASVRGAVERRDSAVTKTAPERLPPGVGADSSPAVDAACCRTGPLPARGKPQPTPPSSAGRGGAVFPRREVGAAPRRRHARRRQRREPRAAARREVSAAPRCRHARRRAVP